MPYSSPLQEHQAWLQELRERHSAHVAGVAPETRQPPLPTRAFSEEGNDMPVGAGTSFDALSSNASRGPSFSGFDERFASIALDGDAFDAPVYRSLSAGLHFEPAGALEFDFNEPPVYRSLSGLAPAAPLPQDRVSVEEADRAWLETMPPLIRRQNAHGPSLGL